MNDDLKRRVRERLDALGLDMKAASLQAGMNATFVRDILSRDRIPRADALMRLAAVLQTTPEWLLAVEGAEADRGLGPAPDKASRSGPLYPSNASPAVPIQYPTERIPMLGRAAAGSAADGRFVLNGQKVGDALIPPQLIGVPDAYGVFVHGDSMEPRYHPGEAVFVNPHLPVRQSDYVVVQIAGEFEGDDLSGYIKRFVSLNSRELVLEQYKRREEVEPGMSEAEQFTLRFSRDRVVAVHKIVSAGIV